MRKLLFGGLVLAVILLARGAAPDGVVAQVKRGTSGGVIQITEGKDGKYRFFVRDADGKLVAMSSPGGFATTKDAQARIDQLKEIVSRAKVTISDKTSGDKTTTKKKRRATKEE